MGFSTIVELKPSISSARRRSRTTLFTAAAKQYCTPTQWPLSDVSCDLTVEVHEAKFSFHKIPLVSRSGRIRRMVAEAKDMKLSMIVLDAFPGGPEAFEIAARFCYGIHIEITINNVATLRCAAHYLEMTEDFADKNLESRTEIFLREVVFPSVSNSLSVLYQCESLLPIAEEIIMVNRLINGVASNLCKEQLMSGLSRLEPSFPSKIVTCSQDIDTCLDWWGSGLTKLSIEFFQRVLSTLRSKGLKQDLISRILINYTENSLHGGPLHAELQKKQRYIIETIVGLLPLQSRKGPVTIAFLSGLLKAAVAASVSTACKLDLERRIAFQLDKAILEDILIPAGPSPSSSNSALFDVESVERIVLIFLNMDDEEGDDDSVLTSEFNADYKFDASRSSKQGLIVKVSELFDSYLLEIAADLNVIPAKFIIMAEVLPDHARLVSDGLYRAIDVFLKVHTNMKESERFRLCKAINCQKLTQEACTHAAQNERLPVQIAIQVLYFEQMRLRSAMNGDIGGHHLHHHHHLSVGSHQNTQKVQNSGGALPGSGAMSPREHYASVRRENRELKVEIARMRMRLADLEKDHVSIKQELNKSTAANIFNSLVKRFSRLNALFKAKRKTNVVSRLLFQRSRRHSVS